jgi:hypothetical protein
MRAGTLIKKYLSLLVVVLLLSTIGTPMESFAYDKRLPRVLRMNANMENLDTPSKQGKYLEFTKVTATENIYQYYYRYLTNSAVEGVKARMKSKEFMTTSKEVAARQMCKAPQMMSMLKKGAIVKYDYHTPSGVFLFGFEFTLDNCR